MKERSKESRLRHAEASRRMWASPTSRKKLMASLRKSWTPERREALSLERQAFWAAMKSAKALAERATTQGIE